MAIIRPTGFFRAKASSLMGAARALVERHGGEVPSGMAELIALPGVGRKTANIVRGNAFGLPGMGVDTHVTRLSRRMGLTRSEDPARIEGDLCAVWPPESWTMATHYLIFHGRRVCDARAPRCGDCVVRDLCPSARTRATAAARPQARRKAERPRAASPRRSPR
jgi:endonuclease-3